jgi:hypothetical protein
MRHEMNLIKSVIGFDLNVTITYFNDKGEEVPICKGCRSVGYTGSEKANIGTSINNGNFFTNYNKLLLDKIRDYQSKHC